MHRLRILVVDDEPQMHRFLGPALKAASSIHKARGARMLISPRKEPPA